MFTHTLVRELERGMEHTTSSGLVIPRQNPASSDPEFSSAKDMAYDLAQELQVRVDQTADDVEVGAGRGQREHGDAAAYAVLLQNLRRATDLAETVASDFNTALDSSSMERLVSLADGISRYLDQIPLDASGIDLADIDTHLPGVEASWLTGLIWNRQTIWPAKVVRHVRAASREIRPGTFQLQSADRGGDTSTDGWLSDRSAGPVSATD